jgi:hypothetical protein
LISPFYIRSSIGFISWIAFAGVWPTVVLAQWPVAVLDYHFGSGQTFGQDAEYFPANVLGPLTAPTGTETPASDPTQVVSLGRGGWLALEFDPPIADEPGADFTVFENAFFYGPALGLVFDEWLRVEASANGTDWFAFPFDSLTGAGLAGRTPTGNFGVDFRDTTQSGGDWFDLATVGLPQARYIRLRDATQWQSADRIAAEVDGVVSLNGTSRLHTHTEPLTLQAWSTGGYVVVQSAAAVNVSLISLVGQHTALGTCQGLFQQLAVPHQVVPGVYTLLLHDPRTGAPRYSRRVLVGA